MLRTILGSCIAFGWSVATAATPPSPVSVSPAVSGGSNQTLTVTFNAPSGYQTLDVLNVLINTALDGRQACYLAYSVSANTLYIVADNGDASQITGKVMNGTGTVANSQCSVALSGSSATGSGNSFTLTLNLTLAASFAGNKVVYAAARDLSQNNSGWQTMGVHNVPGAAATYPNPVGMNPSSGNTQSQTLTFTYQDQTSAANLQTVWALINTALDGRQACYLAYYRPGNQLYLIPDSGDGSQATSITISSGGTLSNSQCSISAQGAAAQTSGSTLTVTVPVTFTNAFAGFKAAWMAAETLSGQVSPWQALGAWSVPAQAAKGTPLISSSPPTAKTSGSTVMLQLPLLNIGTGAATAVQLTSASLGSLSPTSPALPLAVGSLAAGASATVNLSYNTATLTVGTDYLLTLQGTYQFSGAAQPFTLYRIVTYGAPGIFDAPANPVNVTPTLDTAHAVTQQITAAAGGTITATGADGSVFTLVFPANAILTDKPITMTPVSNMAGVPAGSTFAAGVQLAPDGLVLLQPATLTIQPATAIPLVQQVCFSYSASGQDFHPYPFQPGSGVTLQIVHFTGFDAFLNIGDLPGGVPSTSAARLEEVIARLIVQVPRTPLNADSLTQQAAAYLQEYFDKFLMPDAYAAVSDPSKVDPMIDELGTFSILVTILDNPALQSQLRAELDTLAPVMQQAITNAYSGYFNACINNGTFAGVSGRVALGSAMAHENDNYGKSFVFRRQPRVNFPNYLAQLSACLIGSLQANVTLEANGQIAYSSGGTILFDLVVPVQSVPLMLNQTLLQSNIVDFDALVPIHYTQGVQVTVTGGICGSAWKWSEETASPYVPTSLGISAVLDRDVTQTGNTSAQYVFQVYVEPKIFEHYIPAHSDGMGGCLSDNQSGTIGLLDGLFGNTWGASEQSSEPPTPVYVNLDQSRSPRVGMEHQAPNDYSGTFYITATLTQTSQ